MNAAPPSPLPHTNAVFIDVAPLQRVAARSEILRQGDVATHVFLLQSGLVALTLTGPDGRELIVGFRLPGAVIGAASAIAQRPYAVSAITLQRSELRALPTNQFLDSLMSDIGPVAKHFLEMQSREVLDQIDRIGALVLFSARQRVEEFLWEFPIAMSRSVAGGSRIPLNQEEFAQYINTTRQHLNRILRELECDGLIRRSAGCYVVDRARLWRRQPQERP